MALRKVVTLSEPRVNEVLGYLRELRLAVKDDDKLDDQINYLSIQLGKPPPYVPKRKRNAKK